jgi:aryl-alcohol dehydrogenase-like predicted oxidoreductase
MKAAYDIGVNFFDCAEAYSAGDSERVMGRAIKKFGWKRNDLVISTKVCSLPMPHSFYLLTRQQDLLGISIR